MKYNLYDCDNISRGSLVIVTVKAKYIPLSPHPPCRYFMVFGRVRFLSHSVGLVVSLLTYLPSIQNGCGGRFQMSPLISEGLKSSKKMYSVTTSHPNANSRNVERIKYTSDIGQCPE